MTKGKFCDVRNIRHETPSHFCPTKISRRSKARTFPGTTMVEVPVTSVVPSSTYGYWGRDSSVNSAGSKEGRRRSAYNLDAAAAFGQDFDREVPANRAAGAVNGETPRNWDGLSAADISVRDKFHHLATARWARRDRRSPSLRLAQPWRSMPRVGLRKELSWLPSRDRRGIDRAATRSRRVETSAASAASGGTPAPAPPSRDLRTTTTPAPALWPDLRGVDPSPKPQSPPLLRAGLPGKSPPRSRVERCANSPPDPRMARRQSPRLKQESATRLHLSSTKRHYSSRLQRLHHNRHRPRQARSRLQNTH